MTTDIGQAKQAIRERVWARLEEAGAVTTGVRGRIPAFAGADAAARRLADLPVWQAAQVVKAVPDKAQLPVRALALDQGKLVYMAVPKLAQALPFYLLDPATLTVPPEEAAAEENTAQLARTVGVEDMLPVDLVICGSVAVDHRGARLGKGAGYTDIELALLTEAGLLSERSVIVTTVHDLQLLEGEVPEAEHDVRVDLIVTPYRVTECGPTRRPTGLLWETLSLEKIAAIPVLGRMQQANQARSPAAP